MGFQDGCLRIITIVVAITVNAPPGYTATPPSCRCWYESEVCMALGVNQILQGLTYYAIVPRAMDEQFALMDVSRDQ